MRGKGQYRGRSRLRWLKEIGPSSPSERCVSWKVSSLFMAAESPLMPSFSDKRSERGSAALCHEMNYYYN